MKKNLIPIFILFTFLIVFCCTSPEKNPFHIDRVYELEGKKTYFPEIINPVNINDVGDYIIVSELNRIPADLPLLHVLKKSPLAYVFPKGVTGFGPFEIPDAFLVEPGLSDSTFTVYSAMSKKFTDFSLKDTSRLGISEYKQPEELFGMYKGFHATDSTIIGIMANDPNKLVEFSTRDGRRIAGYGTWEKIPNADHLIDYDDPDINYHMGEINAGRFKGNRKRGLFVKANAYRDRLEIFHYKSKTFDIVDGPRMEVPDFEIRHSGSQSAVLFDQKYPLGYGELAIGENFIYVLYVGANFEEIQKTTDIAKLIYVFTHKGDVVSKFNLDISIRDLVVDEELRLIYGLTTDKDPGIAVFELPSEFL